MLRNKAAFILCLATVALFSLPFVAEAGPQCLELFTTPSLLNKIKEKLSSQSTDLTASGRPVPEGRGDIVIAIGDVHGSIGALKAMIAEIRLRYDLNKVRLVFLGDYVDRGESSFKTINYLIHLKKQYPHFVFLMGNHEYMILDGKPWGVNDGTAAQLSYPGGKITPAHLAFMAELDPYFIGKSFEFLHVGPHFPGKSVAGVPIERYDTHEFHKFGYRVSQRFQGKKKVVHGHVAGYNIRTRKKSICIDTACAFKESGILTGLILNDRTGGVEDVISIANPVFDNASD